MAKKSENPPVPELAVVHLRKFTHTIDGGASQNVIRRIIEVDRSGKDLSKEEIDGPKLGRRSSSAAYIRAIGTPS